MKLNPAPVKIIEISIKNEIVIINKTIKWFFENKLINYRIFKITLKEEMKYNILLNIFKILDISQTIIFL